MLALFSVALFTSSILSPFHLFHFGSFDLTNVFCWDFSLTFLIYFLHVLQCWFVNATVVLIFLFSYFQVLETSPQQQQQVVVEPDPCSSEHAGSSWEDFSDADTFSDDEVISSLHASMFCFQSLIIWFTLSSCYLVSLVSSTRIFLVAIGYTVVDIYSFLNMRYISMVYISSLGRIWVSYKFLFYLLQRKMKISSLCFHLLLHAFMRGLELLMPGNN